jgi:hypothetical protein
VWKDLEGDEPCKDQTVYSSSRLSSCDCLWAYKLQYVDMIEPRSRNFSSSVGTILHKSIATAHATNKLGDWGDIFDETWSEEIDRSEESNLPWSADVTDEEMTKSRDDALKVLGNYIERNRSETIIGVEMPFYSVLKHPNTGTRYRFTGTVDQLRVGPNGGIWIPDLKYWKTPPPEAYLSVAKAPTTYGLALKHATFETNDGDLRRFDCYPERLSWYMLRNLLPYKRKVKKAGLVFEKGDLRGEPDIEIHRSPAEYDDRLTKIFRLIQIIRMNLFVEQESPTKCTMCKMSHACTVKHLGFEDAFSISDNGN